MASRERDLIPRLAPIPSDVSLPNAPWGALDRAREEEVRSWANASMGCLRALWTGFLGDESLSPSVSHSTTSWTEAPSQARQLAAMYATRWRTFPGLPMEGRGKDALKRVLGGGNATVYGAKAEASSARFLPRGAVVPAEADLIAVPEAGGSLIDPSKECEALAFYY